MLSLLLGIKRKVELKPAKGSFWRKAAIHTKRDIVVDWNEWITSFPTGREILRPTRAALSHSFLAILHPRLEPQGRTDQNQLLVARTVGVDVLG
jgi:hypothetical protein